MKATRILILALVLLATSCTTPNPQYTPLQPGQLETNTVPKYVVDPRMNSTSNTVTGIATGLAPVNPYAAITDPAIKWGFGIAALIAGTIAAKKNKDANKATAAVQTIAAGVIKAGPQAAQSVIDHASNTPHFATVVTAINDQTGPNQTTTGTAKAS